MTRVPQLSVALEIPVIAQMMDVPICLPICLPSLFTDFFAQGFVGLGIRISTQDENMNELPHSYVVSATAAPESNIQSTSPGLPPLESAPPAQFGGPGDQWSPETLLVAAVADCFILTFRAIARASKFEWTSLECTVDGTLERVERAAQFTRFAVTATLTVPTGADGTRAQRLMEKAESGCLITNSMTAETHLEATVIEG